MIKTLRIRLEPNDVQNTMLFKSAGVSRWAYNWALGIEEENYKQGKKFMSDCDLRKELTRLKQSEEYAWLYDVSNDIPKQAIKDAYEAYKKFFKGLSKHPKFKSKKKSTPGFYQDTSKIKFTDSHVHLTKIGKVRLSETERVPTEVKYYNPRVKYDGLHWYLTVGIEIETVKTILSNESVGIDVGVKVLAAVSNRDEAFPNINKSVKVRKLEKKLKRLQRQVSRKYEMNIQGNKYIKTENIKKTERAIKVVQNKLNNIRADYLQQVSSEIVKTKPSRIVMETLNLKSMMK